MTHLHRAILVLVAGAGAVPLAAACGAPGLESEEEMATLQSALSCPPASAPDWAVGVAYATGSYVSYGGQIFQCLQGHTSQAGWQPPNTPALWQSPTPCGVTPWQTNTAYVTGSRVTYSGITYECIQGHTSQAGWTPPQTPALWRPLSQSTTHRVDAFIMRDVTSCAIGDPCQGSTDNCFKLWNDAHTAPVMAFANNSNLQMVKPGDPRIQSAAQSRCLRMSLSASEAATLRQELESFRDNVAEWTDQAIRLELAIHEITQLTPLEMSTGNLGIFVGPAHVQAAFQPFLSRNTDFILVTYGHHDASQGLHTDVDGCGGAFGSDNGLVGAPYAAIPQTRRLPFQCAVQGVYTHEWLHEVHWALNTLSGFNDLYDGNYPACGMGNSNTTLWFPDTHDCNRDPDFEACGQEVCGDNDTVNSHVLQEHWAPNRLLLSNYCRNGIQDFDETGVDVGGRCP